MIEKLIAENKRRFLLQLFAEGDGDGAGDGNGSGSEGGDGGGDEGQGTAGPLSFDDFLEGEGNQAEFDRRVQKAVNTAVANAQEKWKALTDDKLSEAEKLAKMNKEEKALYKAQQAEAELAAINAPDSILSGLIREDAEKTNEAVKEFVKLFNDAVGEAVKAKARQRTPGEGGGTGAGSAKIDITEMARKARII